MDTDYGHWLEKYGKVIFFTALFEYTLLVFHVFVVLCQPKYTVVTLNEHFLCRWCL